jgi:hypothetical protein
MKVARLPNRPSDLLELRSDLGLSAPARLSFDVACVEYDERMDYEIHATKEVELSPEEAKADRNRKPTKTVRANSQSALMHMLGVPVYEDDESDSEATSVMARAASWFRQLARWPED